MPGQPRTGEGRRPASRRAVLTAAYAAAVAALGSCGVRLDLPPPPASAPTRRKVPDEDVLLDAVRRLRRLAGAAAGLARCRGAGPVLPQVAAVTAGQLHVLRGRLTNAGVPTSAIEAATSPASAIASPAALADSLAQPAPGHWSAVAGTLPQTRALLLAATSAELAAAVLLGRPLPLPGQPSPARAALLERTAALRHGFEVVAAQSRGAQRDRALRSLASLAVLAQELGPGLPSAPAWALPFPVRTPRDAARLAQHVCRAAVASAMAAPGPVPTASSLAETAIWSARVQALATEWGVPLTAFPGATVAGATSSAAATGGATGGATSSGPAPSASGGPA